MDWPTGCRPSGDGILIRWGTPKRSEKLELPHTEAGKRKAAAIRAQRIQEYKFGSPGKKLAQTNRKPLDFFSVAQRFLDRGKPDWSVSTYDSYKNNLNRYWSELGDYPISELTYHDIDAIWDNLQFKTKKTAKNVLTPLKGVFSYAFEKNLVDEDLGKRFRVKGEQIGELDPFTPEEKESILAELQNMEPMAYLYWVVLFDTGMRTPSEPCALTWGDYNGKRFRVHQTIVRRQNAKRTKTKTSRDVYATQRIRDLLQGWQFKKKSDHIFTNTAGTQFKDGDWQNERFYEACERAGVRKRRPYNVRHTWAHMGLMANKKPARLAKHLGHSLEMFFRRYADWIESEEDEADILDIENHYLTTRLSGENGTNMAPRGVKSGTEDITD